jgi:hypothetical protein
MGTICNGDVCIIEFVSEMGSVRFTVFETDLGFGSVRRKCALISSKTAIPIHFLAFYKFQFGSVLKLFRFGSVRFDLELLKN